MTNVADCQASAKLSPVGGKLQYRRWLNSAEGVSDARSRKTADPTKGSERSSAGQSRLVVDPPLQARHGQKGQAEERHHHQHRQGRGLAGVPELEGLQIGLVEEHVRRVRGSTSREDEDVVHV